MSPQMGQGTSVRVTSIPTSAPGPSVIPIAVSVEPTPSVITFKLDELTSQRMGADEDIGFRLSGPDSQGEGSMVRGDRITRIYVNNL